MVRVQRYPVPTICNTEPLHQARVPRVRHPGLAAVSVAVLPLVGTGPAAAPAGSAATAAPVRRPGMDCSLRQESRKKLGRGARQDVTPC